MLKKKLLLALVILAAFVLLADKPFYIITKDGKAVCGRCRVECQLKAIRDDATETTVWYAVCPNCGRHARLTPEEYDFIKDYIDDYDDTEATTDGRHRSRHDEAPVERTTYIPIPVEENCAIMTERAYRCAYCGRECSGDSLFFFDRRTKLVVPTDEVDFPLSAESTIYPACMDCAKKYLLFPDSRDGMTTPTGKRIDIR